MESQFTQINPLAASIAHALAQLSPRDQAAATSDMLAAVAPYLPVKARPAPTAPQPIAGKQTDTQLDDDDQDFEGYAHIAAMINPTDMAILAALSKRLEHATAKDLSEIVCLEARSISNRLVRSKPLKSCGLVMSGGGYRITEKGQRVLKAIRQHSQPLDDSEDDDD